MGGKQKASSPDGVMWEMSIFTVSLHGLRRGQQSLTLSSVEGEEPRAAAAGGWGICKGKAKAKEITDRSNL